MPTEKTSVVNFLTGSVYIGTYYHSIQEMEGFGIYTYPDGNEYRGYFKRGLFHGYGCLTITKASKMLCKGYFNEGKLVSVDEIIFADGLRFDCALEKGVFKKENWKYCIGKDRRYSSEISKGIEPVGPDSLLTSKPPVKLETNKYDTEEGIFNAGGFLSYDINDELDFKMRFISCEEEKNWIRKHCRRGPDTPLPDKILTGFEKEILKNNLKSSEFVESCPCNKLVDRQRGLCIGCKHILNSENKDKSSSDATALTVSSSSCDSLEDESIEEDVESYYLNLRDPSLSKNKSKKDQLKELLLLNINDEDQSFLNPARLSDFTKLARLLARRAHNYKLQADVQRK